MHDPLNVYRDRYKEFIESVRFYRPDNLYFSPSHNHHIIPKCTFSDKEDSYIESKENKIYLTYQEHFIAHRILAEENPFNYKLVAAYWHMCTGKPYIVTPDQYAEALVLWSKVSSESLSGEKNPNYNTRVMNNGVVQKHVHLAEVQEYLDRGFCLGSLPRTEEARMNISKALTGHEVSDETRGKLADSQYAYLENHPHQRLGTSHSVETRLTIASLASIRCKGEGNPMYGKRGVDSPLYGRKKSDEERKNMSDRMIGNKSNSGRICINNCISNKFVLPEDLEYYLENGYVRGRK